MGQINPWDEEDVNPSITEVNTSVTAGEDLEVDVEIEEEDDADLDEDLDDEDLDEVIDDES
jgi:hypothetical protein